MPNLEDKEITLQASREKCQLTYKGKHVRINSDLSAQTPKTRKAWSKLFQRFHSRMGQYLQINSYNTTYKQNKGQKPHYHINRYRKSLGQN
jgi:hypothetical protein